jgi:aryl-alcohol dehydrogenase-like predicted oxidoreductase
MLYSNLVDPDITVSRIGIGCWQLGGHGWGTTSERELVSAVARAQELGINFFDTAPIYGLGTSETLLGRVVGAKRHAAVIATKVGLVWDKGDRFTWRADNSPANIESGLEDSLRRLKTDYVDICYVHWPDPETPVEETAFALEKLKRTGKIRAYGYSNFPLDLLRRAADHGHISAVQLQYNILDRDRESETLSFCRQADIGVVTHSSLAKGLLTGKFKDTVSFGPDDNRSRHRYFDAANLASNMQVVARVKAASQELGMTPAQVSLGWLLENPLITATLVGVKTCHQIEENVATLAHLPFDQAATDLISTITQRSSLKNA